MYFLLYSNKALGLIDIERKICCEKYKNLSEFRQDLNYLFARATDYYHADIVRLQETQRMCGIVQDWFNSLPVDLFLINVDTFCSKLDGHVTEKNEQETSLRILNPDNDGIVSKLERVQSIGQEVC